MQASISLQSYSGEFKLISNSFQEYKFTDKGLHKHPHQQATSGDTFYQVIFLRIAHALCYVLQDAMELHSTVRVHPAMADNKYYGS